LYTNRGSLCYTWLYHTYPGFAVATLKMWNMTAVTITLIFTLFYYTQWCWTRPKRRRQGRGQVFGAEATYTIDEW